MNKKISVTVGIPTYKAGKSLVYTLNSLYEVGNIENISNILVAVDGSKIKKYILDKIKHPKLKIVYYKKRLGQSKRMNCIAKISNSDVLVFGNDDIIFAKNSILNVIKEYTSKKSDLICPRVESLKPRNLLESSLAASDYVKRQIIKMSTKNQSYLIANGRFLALSKRIYKKLNLPKNLINSDSYIYFWASKNKYKINGLDKIACYFRQPSKYSEYVNQVNKFNLSFLENSKYFKSSFLKKYYYISIFSKIRALLSAFKIKPFYTTTYIMYFLSVRLSNYLNLNDKSYIKKGYWKTDFSTKSL